MIKERMSLRVRYAETDQMGFVYYGNYAQYLELGRVAAMKKIGISYRELEESGIGMPVKDLHIDYYKAAQYDDELIVETTIAEKPTNRVVFDYEIFRGEDLLVKAKTTLFFIDLKTLRPSRPPAFFIEKITPYFEQNHYKGMI